MSVVYNFSCLDFEELEYVDGKERNMTRRSLRYIGHLRLWLTEGRSARVIHSVHPCLISTIVTRDGPNARPVGLNRGGWRALM